MSSPRRLLACPIVVATWVLALGGAAAEARNPDGPSASRLVRGTAMRSPSIGWTAVASLAARAGQQKGTTPDASVPQRLRAIIASQLKVGEDKVTATASFVKDLGADELDLVELVMAYEREFKIEISDAEADQFRQVRDVVAYLRKRGALK